LIDTRKKEYILISGKIRNYKKIAQFKYLKSSLLKK